MARVLLQFAACLCSGWNGSCGRSGRNRSHDSELDSSKQRVVNVITVVR